MMNGMDMLATMDGFQQALAAQQQTQQQAIAQQNQLIAALQQQLVQANVTLVSQMQQNLSSLQQQQVQSGMIIAQMQQNLSSQQSALQQQFGALLQSNTTIAQLQQQQAQANATIAQLQQQQTQANATIAQLQQTVFSQQQRIVSLEQQQLLWNWTSVQLQQNTTVLQQQQLQASLTTAQWQQSVSSQQNMLQQQLQVCNTTIVLVQQNVSALLQQQVQASAATAQAQQNVSTQQTAFQQQLATLQQQEMTLNDTITRVWQNSSVVLAQQQQSLAALGRQQAQLNDAVVQLQIALVASSTTVTTSTTTTTITTTTITTPTPTTTTQTSPVTTSAPPTPAVPSDSLLQRVEQLEAWVAAEAQPLSTLLQTVAVQSQSISQLQQFGSQLCEYENSSLPLLQQIPTIGAINWEFFTIGNTSYLAVANYYNGTSLNIPSNIYRFDPTAPLGSQFVLVQQIFTNGANDWEFFTIGNTSYLAVSNNGATASSIFRFDPNAPRGSQFVLVQQIPTSHSQDWEYFTIGNTSYIAMANSNNGTSYNIPSNIYRFDPTAPQGAQFVLVQQIPTSGAFNLEFFTIGNTSYLAVANEYNGNSYNVPSNIYRFDPKAPQGSQFVLVQQITTAGARNWKFFVIGNTSYLALASNNNGTSFNIPSNIYRFDPSAQIGSQFVLVQQIFTSAAEMWEFFTIGSTSYLAVANFYNGLSNTISSNIYRFDPNAPQGSQFVLAKQVPTFGATAWKFFTIGDTSYLALANHYDDTSFNVQSSIYVVVEYCWDTPIASTAQTSTTLITNTSAVPASQALQQQLDQLQAWAVAQDQSTSTLLQAVSQLQQFGSQLCQLDDSPLSLVQRFPTNGAHDWSFFTIGNSSYLAVANVQNNSASYNIPSNIYRFDLTAPQGSQFVLVQQIPTSGASRLKSFTIGNTSYLAVANYFNGTSSNIPSSIFRFDPNAPQGSQFVVTQQILTSEGRDWEFFTIGNTSYLAVANRFNGTSYNIPSNIYRFVPTAPQGAQFVLAQQIATSGAFDLEFFTIGNANYLAVANYFNGTSYNILSSIYRFDTQSFQFMLAQQIPTSGAADWEFFTINNTSYLAVANLFNGISYNIPSNIYRFVPTAPQGSQFVLVKQISTNGAHDWEFFTIGNTNYLSVANHYNGTSNNIPSYIYRIDLDPQQGLQLFPIQQISTSGCPDLTFFTLNGTEYLAVANYYNDSSFNVQSSIYAFVEYCWDTPITSTATQATTASNALTVPASQALQQQVDQLQAWAVAQDQSKTTLLQAVSVLESETVLQLQQFDTQLCQLVNSPFSVALPLVQQISTSGAHTWEFFTIGNTSYLAVANFYNGTSYNLRSNIYRFDPTAPKGSQLVLTQQIPTNGATDCAFFTIGNTSYLAVANHVNSISHNIPSNIYRFVSTAPLGAQFVLAQSISTNGAHAWEFFTIGNTSYLAVANNHNDTSYNTPSNIYRFDPNLSQFVLVQQIPTNGAWDWEFFTIGNTSFLAVANAFNDTSFSISSNIYRFNPSASQGAQFVLAQQIPTNGATDWVFFTIGNTNYLALANSAPGASSSIYRFNSSAAPGSQFVLVQQIATSGAMALEFFTVWNISYLAVANSFGGAYNIPSSIYRFDATLPEGSQFVLARQIPTSGAHDWVYFTIGQTSYLAVANWFDGTSYNVQSAIYGFVEYCWDN